MNNILVQVFPAQYLENSSPKNQPTNQIENSHFLWKSHVGACPTPCGRRAVCHPRGPGGQAGTPVVPSRRRLGRAPDWPARPAGVTASRSPAASGSLVGAQRGWPAAGSGSPATRERARPTRAAGAVSSAERESPPGSRAG